MLFPAALSSVQSRSFRQSPAAGFLTGGRPALASEAQARGRDPRHEKRRTVAVLGDMAELGIHTEAAHREIGRRAAELGVGQLFAIGKMAAVTAQAAREAGLGRVMEFADVESAAGVVKNFLKPGDLVLLKASRSSRLERISEQLRGAEAARKN